MAKAYEISDDLTAPQKEFFERLNHILSITGITTEEMSNHYSEAVTDVVYGVTKASYGLMSDKYSEISKEYVSRFVPLKLKDPFARQIVQWSSYDSPYLKYVQLPRSHFESNLSLKMKLFIRGNNMLDQANTFALSVGKLRERTHVIKETQGPYGLFLRRQTELTDAAAEKDMLSAYASGNVRMEGDSAMGRSVAYPILRGYIKFPMSSDIMISGIEGAVLHLASNKRLSGEIRDVIRRDLDEMKRLSSLLSKYPSELEELERQKNETAAGDARFQHNKMLATLGITEEEWQRRETARIKAEQEKPEPYELNESQREARKLRSDAKSKNWKSIRNNDAAAERLRMAEALWMQELEPVLGQLNRKIPAHAALGDALFSDAIMRQATFTALPREETPDRKKIFGNGVGERESLRKAMIEIIETGAGEQASPTDKKLAQLLQNSPTIAVMASGERAMIDSLRELNQSIFTMRMPEDMRQRQLERLTNDRDALRRSALRSIGLTIAEPELPQPETPLALSPVIPAIIQEVKQEEIPVKPELIVEAPPVVAEPPKPIEPARIEPQPVVMQPKPAAIGEEAPKPAPSKAPINPFAIPASHEAERKALTSRADDFMTECFDAGYRQFSCSLAYGDDRNCVRLQFTNDEGETRSKDLALASGELSNHLLMKMAVQSHVLSQDGIVPRRHLSSSGEVTIHIGDFIQFHAGDPAATQSTIKAGGGLLSLEIVSYDRREDEKIPLSIPLGLADLPENRGEANRRKKVVEDYLKDAYTQDTKVTKREVLDHLRAQAHGKWQNPPEPIYLQGYEESTDFAFPAKDSDQKTKLQPVHMELQPGGLNPSYMLDFALRVSLKEGKKKSYEIKSRQMNLQTADEGLALARANMAMMQLKKVAEEMSSTPSAKWVLEPAQDESKGMQLSRQEDLSAGQIGWQKLNEKLDAMTHYEDDLRAQLKGEPVDRDGTVHFALQVVRGNNRDALAKPYNTAAAEIATPNTQEPFRVSSLSKNALPVPLEIECVIPSSQRDRIGGFVDNVNSEFMATIGEHYTVLNLKPEGEALRDKHLPKYRYKTARNIFTAAVESQQHVLGPDALVTPSWHDGEITHAVKNTRGDSGAAVVQL